MQNFAGEKDRIQALREAQIMKQLSCPHVIGYLDAFIEGGSMFIILEFCEGGDLKAFFMKNSAKALAERTIWRLFLRIALGLEYLHSKRILHRDIKSENIFLTGVDEVRIGDLGLARMLGSTTMMASTLCGTPKYLSPEEASGTTRYDEKCDVWALGVIVYEMCSEKHMGPFLAQSLPALLDKIANEEAPPLPRRTPLALREACTAMLEKDPRVRPNVSEMLLWPSVLDNAERHKVWEVASKDCSDATDGPSSSRQPSAFGVPTSPSNTMRQRHAKVADSPCARIGRCLYRNSEESADGPLFHRLGICEICTAQGSRRSHFSLIRRRHHCRMCGRSVCAQHSRGQRALPLQGYDAPQRVCELCGLLPANGGQPDDERPLVVAADRQALGWDSHMLTAARWAVGKRLCFVGLAADDLLLTVEAAAGACLELRPLASPERIARHVELAAVAPLQPLRQLPQQYQPLGRAHNTLQLVVGVAACSGSWFAALFTSDSGSGNPVVCVLELPTGRCLGHFSASREAVTALTLHNGDGGFVATGAENGAVHVWRVPGSGGPCALHCSLAGHAGSVMSLAVAGNGRFLCSGSAKDKTVRFWRRARSDACFEANAPTALCQDYRATDGPSLCCDGFLVAFVQAPRVGSWEQGASLWNLVLGKWERSFFRRDHSVHSVALRGIVLATASKLIPQRGCTVQLWHAPTGTALSTIAHPSPVTWLLLAGLGREGSGISQ